MELKPAQDLAETLLKTHGLSHWQVRFDHARARCGSCNFDRQEITLSKHFVALNDAQELRLTVLHEIAHALVGPANGHNQRWQKGAFDIGATGQTTNTSAQMPKHRWGIQCQCCTAIVGRRHRRSLKLHWMRCGVCGTASAKLRWIALN